MASSNWTASIVLQGGGFSFGVSNPATGGNPDAYRGIQHMSATGFTNGAVAHLHTTGWDPAAQGAITWLEMAVDVNCFNGGTSNAVGFGLIVEQAGVVYYGPSFTALTGSGWRSDLSHAGLTEADFVNSGAHPDFSAAGAPVRFGFFSSNGTGQSAPISSTSGADNFLVRLVPSPGAGAAAMFSVLALALRRRRG